MNQIVRNLLTYAREWARLNIKKALIAALVLGFVSGAVIAAEPPSVSLSVNVGAGNVPTVTWAAPWATGCTASGGWTGAKAASGTQALPAITASTTYGLTCTAAADTQARLTWEAPTQYTDGTAIPSGGIASYRVYHGNSAASLALLQSVTGLTHTHNGLSVGTHYYAVSAVTPQGLEGSRSAVANKAITAAQSAQASVTLRLPGAPALQVVNAVAYDVRLNGIRFVRNDAVGTVPLGTACHKDFTLADGYYRVERDSVEFSRETSSPVIVARCG